MRAYLAGLVAAVLVAFAVGEAVTAPEPADIPTYWQLEATFSDILPIQVTVSGEETPQLFWYLRYKVTNNTSRERVFVPDFVLYTDTGQVLHAGQKIPAAVFVAIKELVNDPLLLDMSAVAGELLVGEENAKESVAIWRDFGPEVGSFDVFVGGLSGETVEITLPKPIRVSETDAFGNTVEVVKDKIILSKTLQRHYVIPATSSGRTTTAIPLAEEEWVMR